MTDTEPHDDDRRTTRPRRPPGVPRGRPRGRRRDHGRRARRSTRSPATAAPRRRRAQLGALPPLEPAEHPRDHGRPAARRRAGSAPAASAAGAAAEHRAASRASGVSFARHYTASNDCSPARSTMLTGPAHPPDRLHDHRRQHARPGLPDLGHDAARAGLRHLLVREVAPDARRRALARAQRPGGARPLRLRRRHVPLAQRRPRARAGRVDPHDRRAVRALVRRGRPATGRGARRSRSSTRTTSPGGGAGARSPRPRPRRRAGSRALPPNFETPAAARSRARKPRVQRSLQDTSAVSFGEVPVQRPRPRSGLAAVPRPLRQAAARRSTATSARVLAALAQPPPGGREHDRRVHLRPRRVRRLARPARQGRRACTRRRSACR